MKLLIETLAPLHIGNGEEISALDAVISRGKLLVIDRDKFSRIMTRDEIQSFGSWIADEMSRHGRDRRFQPRIENFIGKNIRLQDSIHETADYSIDAPEHLKLEKGIASFIKSGNRAYIPGSEIKGALRTAALFVMCDPVFHEKLETGFRDEAQNNLRWLRKKLIEFDRRNSRDIHFVKDKKSRGKIGYVKKNLTKFMGRTEKKLQNRMLCRQSDPSPHGDIFKHVMIGDAAPQECSRCLYAAGVEIIGTRPLNLAHEMCKTGTEWNVGTFNHRHAYSAGIMVNERSGYSDMQGWLLEETDGIPNLFMAAQWFSSRLLNAEINFYEKFQNLQEKDDIAGKLRDIKEKNRPEAPALRIGKNQGYLSMTMGMLVREMPEGLYERSFVHATRGTSYSRLFPKSRKLTVDHYGDGRPAVMGWISVGAD